MWYGSYHQNSHNLQASRDSSAYCDYCPDKNIKLTVAFKLKILITIFKKNFWTDWLKIDTRLFVHFVETDLGQHWKRQLTITRDISCFARSGFCHMCTSYHVFVETAGSEFPHVGSLSKYLNYLLLIRVLHTISRIILFLLVFFYAICKQQLPFLKLCLDINSLGSHARHIFLKPLNILKKLFCLKRYSF